MKPPAEPQPVGSLVRVVLHRALIRANAATIDSLRELDRALESHDFGRLNQVLAGMARAAGKGGKKR